MSDTPLPKDWDQAVPYLVWGVLIFAFGFEGVVSLVHGDWLPMSVGFCGMVGLTSMLIHWSKLKEKFNDVRWLIAATMLALIVVTMSPFIEQRRWPFTMQVRSVPAEAPHVFDGFNETYDFYKSDLGAPIAAPQVSHGAYEGQHERAMTLLFLPLGNIFILNNDETWARHPTTNWDRLNPVTFNPDFLASIPKNRKAPEGGVAWLWSQDPAKWMKELGWLVWSCSMTGTFHYQRFEHGIMMGNLVHGTKIGGFGRIFLIFDNGKWTSNVIQTEDVPPCSAYGSQ